MNKRSIIQVAVPVPLYTTFDYLLPASGQAPPAAGCRVKVPFGRRTMIGVVTGCSDRSDIDPKRLKPLQQVLDDSPVIPGDVLDLLLWTARYYQHPPGEVISTALPVLLRQGNAAEVRGRRLWRLADENADTEIALRRATKQRQLYRLLQQHDGELDAEQLRALELETGANLLSTMKSLQDKGIVEQIEQPCLPEVALKAELGPNMNNEQLSVVNEIRADLANYQTHLLHGITGSGKTEVYLALAETVLTAGRQVLVLAPEISLTPQLTDRFRRRLGGPVAELHSGLNDSQRLCAWCASANGDARLLIGTRSAIFTPMPDLGLIIVDEEHDGSYKQQDNLRYNARDLALVRARQKNIPVVLGSATPALESLHNAWRGQYRLHHLTKRALADKSPRIELVDLCRQPMNEGLSAKLLQNIDTHLQQGGQVLLFLNRRGFSPVLMCHACGWTQSCKRCDAHMTYHRNKRLLRCHHCYAETPMPTACPDCGCDELISLGAGTERIEQALAARYPQLQVERIDRDSTRRKGSLQRKLDSAQSGAAHILVGTQMLAKGHDFPNVTLVGILDTDQGLYSGDFRAAEHLAQLITQVAGRAGRAHKAGEVLIQTHHPDHPLLQTLLHQGYEGFARAALIEREQVGFPPYRHLALLRCDAIKAEAGTEFMQAARGLLARDGTDGVEVFGPVPAPMEKRAGRYRTQLMLQSAERKPLHRLIQPWLQQLQQLKSASRVRWSLDIDPYDTY
jgi:primosomal protein N' (replication factor Y) (superfamily II helicase)